MTTLTKEYGYLKKRYPDLKDVDFIFGKPEGNRYADAIACYSPKRKAIIMCDQEFGNNCITAYSFIVFLHEVRHALQDSEDYWQSYTKWGMAKLERDADEWAWKEYHARYYNRIKFGRWLLYDTFKRHIDLQKKTYGHYYKSWFVPNI